MDPVRIGDYQTFITEVVQPDLQEFQSDPGNIRKAFHCSTSLFHLSDWIYVETVGGTNGKLQFTDLSGGVRVVNSEKDFANALSQINPDFDLIRGIANASKHLQLRTQSAASAFPTHAANTYVLMVRYGEGPYGAGPYGGSGHVMLAGPQQQDWKVLDLATSVRQMWADLINTNRW